MSETSKSRGERLDAVLEKFEDGFMGVSGIAIGLSTLLAIL